MLSWYKLLVPGKQGNLFHLLPVAKNWLQNAERGYWNVSSSLVTKRWYFHKLNNQVQAMMMMIIPHTVIGKITFLGLQQLETNVNYTTWSRYLFLRRSWASQEIYEVYGNWKFGAMLTQSSTFPIPTHMNSVNTLICHLRPTLIISSYLYLNIPKDIFSSRPPPTPPPPKWNPKCNFVLPHTIRHYQKEIILRKVTS